MAVLSRRWRYLFIESPRTGSTALRKGVLEPHLEGVGIPKNEVRDGDGKLLVVKKHASLADLVSHAVLDRGEADELVKFTTVRNPFDSLVSGYEKRRGVLQQELSNPNSWVNRNEKTVSSLEYARSHSFTEWIEFRLTRRGPRTLWRQRPVRPHHLTGRFLEGIDVVLQFEKLQDDFDALCDRLGVPERYPIPAINVTERDRDYRRYYDSASRELVERVFEPDLVRFAYEF